MTKSTIQCVAEFQKAFEMNDPAVPTMIPASLEEEQLLASITTSMDIISTELLDHANKNKNKLFMRLHLIQEELSELAHAMSEGDMTACLDALVDLTYVVDGTYCTLGLTDIKEKAFDEVHRSNMSKLGEDGKPLLSPGGRVQKGPNYFRPNLQQFLEV